MSKQDHELLRKFALERPTDTQVEIAERFERETKRTLNSETVGIALRRVGLIRVRPAKLVDHPKPKDPHRFKGEHRKGGPPNGYPTSLTDVEWGLVRDLFEEEGPGRPPEYTRRRMLDAIIYVVRGGIPWRMLPKDFPKWENVYATFRRWTEEKKFEEMHVRLAAMWRRRIGKDTQPTAAILDSQSVRTSPQGGPRGIDANKKIVGRKRHLVTDTTGLILAVIITAASVQDAHAAKPAMDAARVRYTNLKALFVDSVYQGKCAAQLRDEGLDVRVIRRADWFGQWTVAQLEIPAVSSSFTVLPKRWVIERTNGWLSNGRRLARDYDRLLQVSVSWIWLFEARNLLRRLAR